MIWNIRKRKTPNQNSKKKKGIQKKNDSLRGLWDNCKHTTICTMGVPEGGERERKDLKTYLKTIMKENFPDLVKDISI